MPRHAAIISTLVVLLAGNASCTRGGGQAIHPFAAEVFRFEMSNATERAPLSFVHPLVRATVEGTARVDADSIRFETTYVAVDSASWRPDLTLRMTLLTAAGRTGQRVVAMSSA